MVNLPEALSRFINLLSQISSSFVPVHDLKLTGGLQSSYRSFLFPQDNNPEVGTRDIILVTADFWTSLHRTIETWSSLVFGDVTVRHK